MKLSQEIPIMLKQDSENYTKRATRDNSAILCKRTKETKGILDSSVNHQFISVLDKNAVSG